MPTRARLEAAQSPRSTSASRAASSRASTESGAIPTAAAASLTSRRTASSTRGHPPPARTRRRTARRPGRRRARRARASSAAAPIALRTSGRVASSSSAASSVSTSCSSTGTFERHVVGKLREPADVADDERLAERERPDRGTRRLAHRRRAQVDVHVSGHHQRPEPAPRRRTPRARCRHRRGRAAAGADRGRSPATWRRRAGAPLPGAIARHARERLEELRDALARVDVPERAEERLAAHLGRGRASGTGNAGCGTTQIGPS